MGVGGGQGSREHPGETHIPWVRGAARGPQNPPAWGVFFSLYIFGFSFFLFCVLFIRLLLFLFYMFFLFFFSVV